MSGQTEIIVGYDAREYFSAFSKTWQKDRIDQYLLTDQIRKPLSTDVMVWTQYSTF